MLRSLLRWTLVFVIWSSASLAGPLHDAVKDGDLARLQELIEAGKDLAAQDKFVGSSLHWAALSNNADAARLLIDAGIDVDLPKTGDRQTALHIAAERDSADVASLLIEAGANIAAPDSNGFTSLHIAAGSDSVSVARLLIRAGADIEVRSPKTGWTPLMSSATGNALSTAELLVAAGAEIDAKQSGQTALYLATGRGGPEVVRLLIDLGADVNGAPHTEPVHPTTPLANAIALKREETASILRAAGAAE